MYDEVENIHQHVHQIVEIYVRLMEDVHQYRRNEPIDPNDERGTGL